MNNLLGYTIDILEDEVYKKGYTITNLCYLNEPPGIPRVVRIKEETPQNIHVLVSYEKQLISK